MPSRTKNTLCFGMLPLPRTAVAFHWYSYLGLALIAALVDINTANAKLYYLNCRKPQYSRIIVIRKSNIQPSTISRFRNSEYTRIYNFVYDVKPPFRPVNQPLFLEP